MSTTGYEEELKAVGGFEKILLKQANEFYSHAGEMKYSPPDYHEESLAKAKKLSKMRDDQLLNIAKDEYKKSAQYKRKDILENSKKISLIEETIEKIDFALKRTKHAEIKEELDYFKKFYQKRIEEVTADIIYQSKELEKKKSDLELITEKKAEIKRDLVYYKNKLNEKKRKEQPRYEKKAEEYMKLYVLLNTEKIKQKKEKNKIFI